MALQPLSPSDSLQVVQSVLSHTPLAAPHSPADRYKSPRKSLLFGRIGPDGARAGARDAGVSGANDRADGAGGAPRRIVATSQTGEAESTPLLEAHDALGTTLFHLGDYAASWPHIEQNIALTDPRSQRILVFRHDVLPRVRCLAVAANTLWCLGYAVQAVWRQQEALALAQSLTHPYSLAQAHYWAAFLQQRRRDAPAVQAQAEALLTLATAQGFPLWVGFGICWRGWALAMQGQGAASLAQRHGNARYWRQA